MSRQPVIIFVCEHGAAKSILAAAHFNRLASELGSELRAIARGTHPDQELSPQTVKGLSSDGLEPTESAPQKLTEADFGSAQQIVTFCELTADIPPNLRVEHWTEIPPVSENYEKAREAILERIRRLLEP